MAIASGPPIIAQPAESTLPPVPALPWRTGIWVTVAALAWIAMGELDRLSGQVPDPLGRVLGFSDLMGLFASSEGWSSLGDSLIPRTIGWWLLAYLGLDVVFIVCYLRLGFWLRRPWPWVGRCIMIMAVVDLFEDLLAARVAGLLLDGEGILVAVDRRVDVGHACEVRRVCARHRHGHPGVATAARRSGTPGGRPIAAAGGSTRNGSPC